MVVSSTDYFPKELDGLYNLPFTPSVTRQDVYSSIIREYAQGRRLRILEIGVFKAGLIIGMSRLIPELIDSYTGVDPYIGDESDPYHINYWKGDETKAFSQYDESLATFKRLGGTLIRAKSDDFFATNTETWDVIIVDGDHRVEPARRDLHNALAALEPGGLLVCDDYGNSDTPEVTRAVVKFVEEAGDFHDGYGFRPVWFVNARKPVPIQLSAVYWRKKS